MIALLLELRMLRQLAGVSRHPLRSLLFAEQLAYRLSVKDDGRSNAVQGWSKGFRVLGSSPPNRPLTLKSAKDCYLRRRHD